MASNELMVVSLWKYIRQVLFSKPDPSTNISIHTEKMLPGHGHTTLLNPSDQIRNLEAALNINYLPEDEIAKYKADVDYFMQQLDSLSDQGLERYMSEIYELQALIEKAEGDEEHALSDLESALSLNPQGMWLVSNAARVWARRKSTAYTPMSATHNHKPDKENPNNGFHNTWTEDISGWGYSPDSRFNKVRHQVFKRDGYRCVWCGSDVNLTVDHIRERNLGGTNDMSNLRTLCKDCHEKRHGRKIFDREFEVDDDYGFAQKGNAKLIALVNAADSGQGICINYEDREGLKSIRIIHPTRIYKARYIFVNAYCELDKEQRVFRLSRMKISEMKDNRYMNKTNSYTSSSWRGPIPFNTNTGRTIYQRPASSKIRSSTIR